MGVFFFGWFLCVVGVVMFCFVLYGFLCFWGGWCVYFGLLFGDVWVLVGGWNKFGFDFVVVLVKRVVERVFCDGGW